MKINGRMVGGEEPYIVAEIGANYGGGPDKLQRAKLLITLAAECGADAVKFQKRDLSCMTKALRDSPYENENSYGRTYGEHRAALEFTAQEWEVLVEYARKRNVTMFATAFDISSAWFLRGLDMPAYKIASADLSNLPLLDVVSQFQRPIIISTGAGASNQVETAAITMRERSAKYALLHCSINYPAGNCLELCRIEMLKKYGPIVGYSSHHPGIQSHFLAYMLGARIFEAHFTDNRANKGTDHAFSLEPAAMRVLCNDLRRIPEMVNGKEPPQISAFRKMGKSIWPTRTIRKGETLTEHNIALKVPADGLPASVYPDLIGRSLICDLSTAEPIMPEHLE